MALPLSEQARLLQNQQSSLLAAKASLEADQSSFVQAQEALRQTQQEVPPITTISRTGPNDIVNAIIAGKNRSIEQQAQTLNIMGSGLQNKSAQLANEYEAFTKNAAAYNENVASAKLEIDKLSATPTKQEDIDSAQTLFGKGYISQSAFESYKTTALGNISNIQDVNTRNAEITRQNAAIEAQNAIIGPSNTEPILNQHTETLPEIIRTPDLLKLPSDLDERSFGVNSSSELSPFMIGGAPFLKSREYMLEKAKTEKAQFEIAEQNLKSFEALFTTETINGTPKPLFRGTDEQYQKYKSAFNIYKKEAGEWNAISSDLVSTINIYNKPGDVQQFAPTEQRNLEFTRKLFDIGIIPKSSYESAENIFQTSQKQKEILKQYNINPTDETAGRLITQYEKVTPNEYFIKGKGNQSSEWKSFWGDLAVAGRANVVATETQNKFITEFNTNPTTENLTLLTERYSGHQGFQANRNISPNVVTQIAPIAAQNTANQAFVTQLNTTDPLKWKELIPAAFTAGVSQDIITQAKQGADQARIDSSIWTEFSQNVLGAKPVIASAISQGASPNLISQMQSIYQQERTDYDALKAAGDMNIDTSLSIISGYFAGTNQISRNAALAISQNALQIQVNEQTNADMNTLFGDIAAGKNAVSTYDITTSNRKGNQGEDILDVTVNYQDEYGQPAIATGGGFKSSLGLSDNATPAEIQSWATRNLGSIVGGNFKVGSEDTIVFNGNTIQTPNLEQDQTLLFDDGSRISPLDYGTQLGQDYQAGRISDRSAWNAYQDTGRGLPQDYFAGITRGGGYTNIMQANAAARLFEQRIRGTTPEEAAILTGMLGAGVVFTEESGEVAQSLSRYYGFEPSETYNVMPSVSQAQVNAEKVIIDKYGVALPDMDLNRLTPSEITGLEKTGLITITTAPAYQSTIPVPQNPDITAKNNAVFDSLSLGGKIVTIIGSQSENLFSNIANRVGIPNYAQLQEKSPLTDTTSPSPSGIIPLNELDAYTVRDTTTPGSAAEQAGSWYTQVQAIKATEGNRGILTVLGNNQLFGAASVGVGFGVGMGVISKVVPWGTTVIAGTRVGRAVSALELGSGASLVTNAKTIGQLTSQYGGAGNIGVGVINAGVGLSFLIPLARQITTDVGAGQYANVAATGMSLAVMGVGAKTGEAGFVRASPHIVKGINTASAVMAEPSYATLKAKEGGKAISEIKQVVLDSDVGLFGKVIAGEFAPIVSGARAGIADVSASGRVVGSSVVNGVVNAPNKIMTEYNAFMETKVPDITNKLQLLGQVESILLLEKKGSPKVTIIDKPPSVPETRQIRETKHSREIDAIFLKEHLESIKEIPLQSEWDLNAIHKQTQPKITPAENPPQSTRRSDVDLFEATTAATQSPMLPSFVNKNPFKPPAQRIADIFTGKGPKESVYVDASGNIMQTVAGGRGMKLIQKASDVKEQTNTETVNLDNENLIERLSKIEEGASVDYESHRETDNWMESKQFANENLIERLSKIEEGTSIDYESLRNNDNWMESKQFANEKRVAMLTKAAPIISITTPKNQNTQQFADLEQTATTMTSEQSTPQNIVQTQKINQISMESSKNKQISKGYVVSGAVLRPITTVATKSTQILTPVAKSKYAPGYELVGLTNQSQTINNIFKTATPTDEKQDTKLKILPFSLMGLKPVSKTKNITEAGSNTAQKTMVFPTQKPETISMTGTRTITGQITGLTLNSITKTTPITITTPGLITKTITKPTTKTTTRTTTKTIIKTPTKITTTPRKKTPPKTPPKGQFNESMRKLQSPKEPSQATERTDNISDPWYPASLENVTFEEMGLGGKKATHIKEKREAQRLFDKLKKYGTSIPTKSQLKRKYTNRKLKTSKVL